MGPKEVILCQKCSRCVIDIGVGFHYQTIYICSDRGGQVVCKDDGCTFGERGTPMIFCREHKIDNIDPAVNGW